MKTEGWNLKKAEGTTAGGRKPKLVLVPGRAGINSVFQMVVFIKGSLVEKLPSYGDLKMQ